MQLALIGPLFAGAAARTAAYLGAVLSLVAMTLLLGIFVGLNARSRRTWRLFLYGIALITAPILLATLHRGLRLPSAVETDWEGLAASVAGVAMVAGASLAPWTSQRFRSRLRVHLKLALLVHLAMWAASGFDIGFVGLSAHKNVVGGTALTICILDILLARSRLPTSDGRGTRLRQSPTSLSALSVLVSIAAGSRTSIALIGLALAFTIIGGQRRGHRRTARRLLTFAFLACAFGPILYVSLPVLPFYDSADAFLIRATGLPIHTGREDLWREVLEESQTDLIAGHGNQFALKYTEKSLNAHNLLLAKLYQVGLIGVGTFAMYITILHRVSGQTIVGAGTLSLIILHQAFEVNLFAGGWPVGIAIAAVMGGLVGVRTARRGF